jgi:hypothetical protein
MGTTNAFLECSLYHEQYLLRSQKSVTFSVKISDCSVRYSVVTFMFFCLADTFQALIQYPDVVTAQAAKLVSDPGMHTLRFARLLLVAYAD